MADEEEMNKQIPIRCKGNRFIPFDKLKTFQGDLKEMSVENAGKLKASILKHGWVAPVFVWNKNEILDGHGRLLVLGELLKEGYTIGDLPVVDIEARTKKEAAEILLAINSKYQTITDEGLYHFMSDMELNIEDLADIELPDIDIGRFEDNYIGDANLEKEITECLKNYTRMHVLFSFSPSIFPKIMELLDKIKNTDGIEYEQSSNG